MTWNISIAIFNRENCTEWYGAHEITSNSLKQNPWYEIDTFHQMHHGYSEPVEPVSFVWKSVSYNMDVRTEPWESFMFVRAFGYPWLESWPFQLTGLRYRGNRACNSRPPRLEPRRHSRNFLGDKIHASTCWHFPAFYNYSMQSRFEIVTRFKNEIVLWNCDHHNLAIIENCDL